MFGIFQFIGFLILTTSSSNIMFRATANSNSIISDTETDTILTRYYNNVKEQDLYDCSVTYFCDYKYDDDYCYSFDCVELHRIYNHPYDMLENYSVADYYPSVIPKQCFMDKVNDIIDLSRYHSETEERFLQVNYYPMNNFNEDIFSLHRFGESCRLYNYRILRINDEDINNFNEDILCLTCL